MFIGAVRVVTSSSRPVTPRGCTIMPGAVVFRGNRGSGSLASTGGGGGIVTVCRTWGEGGIVTACRIWGA